MSALSAWDFDQAAQEFSNALDQGAVSDALLMIEKRKLFELAPDQRRVFLEKAIYCLNQPVIAALCPQPDQALLNSDSHSTPPLSIALIHLGNQAISLAPSLSAQESSQVLADRLSLVALLLDLGADPMKAPGQIRSPLGRSLRIDLPTVELLLARGAKPSPDDLRLAVDFNIDTPIFSALLAAKKPRPAEIEQLMQRSETRSPSAFSALTAFQESKAIKASIGRKAPPQAKRKARL